MGVMRLTSRCTSPSASAADGNPPHRVGRRGTYLQWVVRRPPSPRSSKIVPAGCPCWRTGVDSSLRGFSMRRARPALSSEGRRPPSSSADATLLVRNARPGHVLRLHLDLFHPELLSPSEHAGAEMVDPSGGAGELRGAPRMGLVSVRTGASAGAGPRSRVDPQPSALPAATPADQTGPSRTFVSPWLTTLQRLVVEHLREGDERLVALEVDDGARVRAAAPCRRYRSTTTSWTSETVFNFRMRGGRAWTDAGGRVSHYPLDAGGSAGEQGGDEDERDDDGGGGTPASLALHWLLTVAG